MPGVSKGQPTRPRARRAPRAGRTAGKLSLIVGVTSLSIAAGSGHDDPLAGMRAYPVGFGTKATDEQTNPWTLVTDATVAPLLTPRQRRTHPVRRIAVDYDADGVQDMAWMVASRTQMGVLVRLGASGRAVLAYRAEGRWTDQRLYRIGQRAIGIEFPESTFVALSSQSGRPMVYFREEGGGG